MYDHTRQYRCTIIRGKSQKEMDDFLPAYANDALWVDTLNITRNEWVAAQQHRDFYSIFRVYFTRDGISMFVLKTLCRSIKMVNSKQRR